MVFLLVFIFFLDFASIKYLDSTSQKIDSLLSKVEDHIKSGDWEKAKDWVEKAESEWKKIDRKWALLVEHREIDEIEINMEKLKSFVESKNRDQSMAQLKTVKMLLKYVPENEKPTFENIF
ncbi:hypothetical protein CDSM653_00495 [Caldanaerobacter subterraneus subsp. pacificus DSM 12653]|uniref:DUF4363 domain-containing protein n=1 Tax=Caldanaerobacter subterraneus subsp. pacificus DSM 12653 TaxID=391606 RepID=A0A0F5PP75_9THEO|nr:hypothetical protein CDSM653_00495 [Caldanaerobacter subterraneus subsp. pacificus DSM 12653]